MNFSVSSGSTANKIHTIQKYLEYVVKDDWHYNGDTPNVLESFRSQCSLGSSFSSKACTPIACRQYDEDTGIIGDSVDDIDEETAQELARTRTPVYFKKRYYNTSDEDNDEYYWFRPVKSTSLSLPGKKLIHKFRLKKKSAQDSSLHTDHRRLSHRATKYGNDSDLTSARKREKAANWSLQEEMKWNKGLALWVERRNVWTKAVSKRQLMQLLKKPPVSVTTATTSRCTSWESKLLDADVKLTMNTMNLNHEPELQGGLIEMGNTMRQGENDDDDDHDDDDTPNWVPVFDLIPHKLQQRYISSEALSILYSAFVRYCNVPSVPIKLSDVLTACVWGWKQMGEWPIEGLEQLDYHRNRQSVDEEVFLTNLGFVRPNLVNIPRQQKWRRTKMALSGIFDYYNASCTKGSLCLNVPFNGLFNVANSFGNYFVLGKCELFPEMFPRTNTGMGSARTRGLSKSRSRESLKRIFGVERSCSVCSRQSTGQNRAIINKREKTWMIKPIFVQTAEHMGCEKEVVLCAMCGNLQNDGATRRESRRSWFSLYYDRMIAATAGVE